MPPRSRRCSGSSFRDDPHRWTPRPLRTGRFRVRAGAALLCLLVASGSADGLTLSAFAATDLPPAPPTQVQAIDVPGDQGGAIEINWTLSQDDHPRFRGVGSASVLGAGGPTTVYRDNGVDGYRVYRRLEDVETQLIAEVTPQAGASH